MLLHPGCRVGCAVFLGCRVRHRTSLACGREHSASDTAAGWAAIGPTGLGAHSPQGFGCSVQGLLCHLRSATVAGVGAQEVGVAAAGEFPKQPPSASFFTFSFREIPPIQACCSIQGPGLSHSPTLQSDLRLSRSGPVTDQLSPASVHSLSGYTQPLCVCHFVLIPP